MRRVIKSYPCPKPLSDAPELTEADDPKSAIYGHKDVKDQLLRDQHNKCIYCECKLNGDHGHVEHYRPKGGYSLLGDKKLYKPGYYWLAYDWSNLLLSCSKCNDSYKKNHFQLEDEKARNIKKKKYFKRKAAVH